jgi:hypothetical protein
MTARPATVADLDAIMALERASFPTDAWSDAMMREELTSRHSWYVVDEEAGRLVGYGGIRAAKGSTDADIQTIAIAESARSSRHCSPRHPAVAFGRSSSRCARTTRSPRRSTHPRASSSSGAGRATTSPTASTPS